MLERKRDRLMHMGCEDSKGRTSVSRKSEREKERERERERERGRERERENSLERFIWKSCMVQLQSDEELR